MQLSGLQVSHVYSLWILRFLFHFNPWALESWSQIHFWYNFCLLFYKLNRNATFQTKNRFLVKLRTNVFCQLHLLFAAFAFFDVVCIHNKTRKCPQTAVLQQSTLHISWKITIQRCDATLTAIYNFRFEIGSQKDFYPHGSGDLLVDIEINPMRGCSWRSVYTSRFSSRWDAELIFLGSTK